MRKGLLHFVWMVICTLCLVCCTQDIDESVSYVFKYDTAVDYLSRQPYYSEYYNMLDKITVSPMSRTTFKQLLSARGHYTIFAPTNEAIDAYLHSLVKKEIIPEPRWDAFNDSLRLDSVRKAIVSNSIIDSGDSYEAFEIANFPTKKGSEIPIANMNNRKLNVQFGNTEEELLVSDCPIDARNRDIRVINGVIHSILKVVDPAPNSLGYLIRQTVAEKKEGFYVASQLAMACGLYDTLNMIRDEVYEQKYQSGEIPATISSVHDGNTHYAPEHRNYGYTYFAETDSLWSQLLGKPAMDITVKDVYDYIDAQGIYPNAKRNTDYESEDNLLNQFVTSHQLPERLSTDHLVYHYNEHGYNIVTGELGCAIMEYYTTMGKRRLLKIFESKESHGVYLNRFPRLNNGRHGDYHELSCDPEKEGCRVGEPNLEGENNVRNGIIYPLDKLLWYSDDTRNNLQSTRIRFTGCAMWPEFINNDIRLNPVTDNQHLYTWIPSDDYYHYLEGVDIKEGSEFVHWTGYNQGWCNMQAGETNIGGSYDVIMKLPPVPRSGYYELRHALSGGGIRGIAQFYWGSDKNNMPAMGIPLNLSQMGTFVYTEAGNIPSDIGYEEDVDDDEYNANIDKKLRIHDYMKSVNQYCAGSAGAPPLRTSSNNLRRILFRQYMDSETTYYIRFKTVLDGASRQFYLNFFELCPKEVYDNPYEPEDIW